MTLRKIILISFIILGIFLQRDDIAFSQQKTIDKKTYNQAFGLGEKLEYKVVYKYITAGTGVFEIGRNPVYRNNRQCYDIRFQVASLKSLEWIYKVKDTYQTVLDAEGIFPWEFEQHIREGNYKRDYKAIFDQLNNKATTSDDKSYTIPPYVNDIVSAFYYVRTLDLSNMKAGSIIQLQNFFKGKTNNLAVRVLGKQTVEVEAGKFKTIVIQPMVVDGGLFKSEGEIYIWLTDDANKIPLKVSTKIVIGNVYAELTKYSGLRNPVTSQLFQ